MLPVRADLHAYRGDTWAQTFTLLDDPGTPHDLTGASVEAWMFSEQTREVEQLLVSTVDAAGSVSISFPANGDSPAAGSYRYDLEVTEIDGRVTTWVCGKITVRQDVTNAV